VHHITSTITSAVRRRRSRTQSWWAYFGSFGDDFFSDTDAD
jgi:hypothetical protein